MQRSSTGCWTCKVRHRKCDEGRPVCKECQRAQIQCHGFGPKPNWMDGGQLQRREADHIRASSKETRTRRRRENRLGGVTTDGKHTGARGHGPQSNTSGPDDVVGKDQLDSTSYAGGRVNRGELSRSSAVNRGVRSFEEADLVMHYLDVVLPLQYPYSSTQCRQRMRSWILWLIAKNESLSSAVFSLSALHRRTMSLGRLYDDREDLVNYHTSALRNLQRWLEAHQGFSDHQCNETQVEFLAVGSSLISFEVFQAGIHGWQIHLDALVTVIGHLLPAFRERHAAEMFEPVAWTTHASMFLVGVVLWFDVVGALCLRRSPQSKYNNWLLHSSIKMGDIIGCQNHVFAILGDIACAAAEHGTFETETLDHRTAQLEETMLQALRSLEKPCEGSPVELRVTWIFGYAGLTQARILRLGPDPTLTPIQDVVQAVIHELQRFPDNESVGGLVWPLTVVGSVAQAHQEQIFEDLITRRALVREIEFGNRSAVLRILRACWSMRRVEPDKACDWWETKRGKYALIDGKGSRGDRFSMARVTLEASLVTQEPPADAQHTQFPKEDGAPGNVKG